MRVRQRAEKRRRLWPKTVEEELRDGVDLDRYTNRLARWFAKKAPTARDPVDDLRYARQIEDGDFR